MIHAVDPKLFRRISCRRADESGLPWVTYCADCRMALADTGREAVHIADFLLSDDWRNESRIRPSGSVKRYANRLRTKWAFKRLRPVGAE
jgi:hypothetical protein